MVITKNLMIHRYNYACLRVHSFEQKKKKRKKERKSVNVILIFNATNG